MHREILYKPTENKEFICSVDNSLIYHTRQVWSAFDNNDVKEFLKNLAYISVDNRYRLKIIPIRYDRRNKISDALDEWINLVKWMVHPSSRKMRGNIIGESGNE